MGVSSAALAAQKLETSNRLAIQSVKSKAPSKQTATLHHLGETYTQLPLDVLHASDALPRTHSNLQNLETLTASVKAKGVIVPILVRPAKSNSAQDYYDIVAGLDRYKAANKAGLKTIPALIRDMTDIEALEYSLMENSMRNDLGIIDETESVVLLVSKTLTIPKDEAVTLIRSAGKNPKEAGYNVIPQSWKTIQDIFSTLGKNIASFRANNLPTLDWPDEVKMAVRQGSIAPSKGAYIARIEDEEQRKALLDKAVEQRMTVKQIKQETEGDNDVELCPKDLKNKAESTWAKLKNSDVWSCPDRKEKLASYLRQINKLIGSAEDAV